MKILKKEKGVKIIITHRMSKDSHLPKMEETKQRISKQWEIWTQDNQ
jgi:hypothetical protein